MISSNQSDYHQTIHLSSTSGSANSVNLNWTQYQGLDVSSYLIYRGETMLSMEMIGYVSGNQTSYTDLNSPIGTSIYQVGVITQSCYSMNSDTLKSNTIQNFNSQGNNNQANLEINFVIVNPSCISCDDGYIIAFPYGGVFPYIYTWTNGVGTNFNFNLPIGSYTLYISDGQGELISTTITLESPDIVEGCTDVTANNYNTEANIDDGSCEYDVFGCLDITANNYNAEANIDDGSCEYDVYGCTDLLADNYNAEANIDDGSCSYPTFTTFNVNMNCFDGEFIQFI